MTIMTFYLRPDTEKRISEIYNMLIWTCRHGQQRTSLLGKPVRFKTSRRDARLKKAQAVVYNFLERPSGKAALCYHAVVFCFVFMCLALSGRIQLDSDSSDTSSFWTIFTWGLVRIWDQSWFSVCHHRGARGGGGGDALLPGDCHRGLVRDRVFCQEISWLTFTA